mgnify:CR=1 FL=1|tara:strand:+ start:368 stop:862 length:495 start_codon:yes stop_codon:yes gene_type:complete
MSQLNKYNLNSVGHETISLINDFSHQILNNVCEFVQPVVQHINPRINITNNTNDYVNKYIDLERNETDEYIMLLGYLPGVQKNALNISLNKTKLILSGKTNQTTSDDYDWSFVKNRHYYRTFNVSPDTTSEDISVTYSDGVLKVIIKKHNQVETSNISVNIEIQ